MSCQGARGSFRPALVEPARRTATSRHGRRRRVLVTRRPRRGPPDATRCGRHRARRGSAAASVRSAHRTRRPPLSGTRPGLSPGGVETRRQPRHPADRRRDRRSLAATPDPRPPGAPDRALPHPVLPRPARGRARRRHDRRPSRREHRRPDLHLTQRPSTTVVPWRRRSGTWSADLEGT